MIGTRLHPRSASITIVPSMPAEAEIEQDDVGMLGRRHDHRRFAGVGLEDLVSASSEIEAQRAPDLRFVVDHEHLDQGVSRAAVSGSWASGIEIVTVSPPPGVSSSAIVPPIASMKPCAIGRPSPTPSGDGRSPSRWNGAKTLAC